MLTRNLIIGKRTKLISSKVNIFVNNQRKIIIIKKIITGESSILIMILNNENCLNIIGIIPTSKVKAAKFNEIVNLINLNNLNFSKYLLIEL